MDDPRIVVAQAPIRRGAAQDPVPVGVLRFAGPNPALGVVVKVTLTYAEDAPEEQVVVARLAEQQEPLSVNRFRKGPNGEDELAYASDFIPFKPLADVLLLGHAHGAPRPSSVAPDGAPTTVVEVSFEIEGELSRAVDVVSQGWVEQIPLRPPYLRNAADATLPAPPVGPIAAEHILSPLPWHPPDFDYQAYNAATPEQRIGEIPRDAKILLSGLSPRVPRRTVVLPGLAPRVICDLEGSEKLAEVELFCDTLIVDADRERMMLLFRGEIPTASLAAREVGTLVVALLPEGDPDAIDAALRALPHGRFFFARSPVDFEEGAPPVPDDAPALTMARYATWAAPQGPEPTIPIERYAQISAELAEQREPRGQTLARHDLDEDRWTLEERAWVEAIAGGGAEGPGSLAAEYGQLFMDAQDRLADPAEERRTLADFARISVAMERRDAVKVLADEKLTLSAFMRLDRRMGVLTSRDEDAAAELDRLLDEERDKPFEPDPDEEPDEEG
ncbi:MAG: DUF2169 domain-containing protein [Byssovorax sp.]